MKHHGLGFTAFPAELTHNDALVRAEVEDLPVLFATLSFDSVRATMFHERPPGSKGSAASPLVLRRLLLSQEQMTRDSGPVMRAVFDAMNLAPGTPILLMLPCGMRNVRRRAVVARYRKLGHTHTLVLLRDFCFVSAVLKGNFLPPPHFLADHPEGELFSIVSLFDGDLKVHWLTRTDQEHFHFSHTETMSNVSGVARTPDAYCKRLVTQIYPTCFAFVTDDFLSPLCELAIPHTRIVLYRQGFEYACYVGVKHHLESSPTLKLTHPCGYNLELKSDKGIKFVDVARKPLPFQGRFLLPVKAKNLTVNFKCPTSNDTYESEVLACRHTGQVEVIVCIDDNGIATFSVQPVTPPTITPTQTQKTPLALSETNADAMGKGKGTHFTLGHKKVSMRTFENGTKQMVRSETGKTSVAAVLSLRHESPCIGEAAQRDLAVEPQCVVYDLMQLVGRRLNEVQRDPEWPFELVPTETDDESFNVAVQTATGRRFMRPEHLLALQIKEMALLLQNQTGVVAQQIRFSLPGDFDRTRLQNAVTNAAHLVDMEAIY